MLRAPGAIARSDKEGSRDERFEWSPGRPPFDDSKEPGVAAHGPASGGARIGLVAGLVVGLAFVGLLGVRVKQAVGRCNFGGGCLVRSFARFSPGSWIRTFSGRFAIE